MGVITQLMYGAFVAGQSIIKGHFARTETKVSVPLHLGLELLGHRDQLFDDLYVLRFYPVTARKTEKPMFYVDSRYG